MLWQRPASLFWFVECIQIFNLKWSWYIPFTCAMEGKQDIEHLEVLTSTTPDLVEHVLFIGEKKSKFWVIVHDFWAFWSPGGTPYPSPDTLWMIIFSLGHSIMCVPKRNLIQCMGDMALMAIIFFVISDDFLDLWSPDGTHILHQTPYEWLFYLWDPQSCMYQWKIWFNVWVIWL